ncbi:MAG: hypothetical protein Q3X69_06150 [Alistipes sp.]|nr:hypothetical protein [Alistipes sp.]
MTEIKHSGRYAEIEHLLDDYFKCHLAPVMRRTQTELTRRQGEEMKEYSTSLGGILSMMASSNMPVGDPYQTLRVTGEWNSKTTEDYIGMCKESIIRDEALQKDLALMAAEWRNAVVGEVGRERYDELSGQLGGDLAYAYVDYRVEQLMIEKLVKERMPKSTSDYIIRKAAESSLLGLTQVMSRSPLTAEIEARGEAAYNPSRMEKGAGWAVGAVADTLMMGGGGSWAAFGKLVGADVALSAVMSHLDKTDNKEAAVEMCISQGVFGSESNVFDSIRREASKICSDQSEFIAAANGQLEKKIPLRYGTMDWLGQGTVGFMWTKPATDEERERAERYKDVPLVIAPGHEEAYLREKAGNAATVAAQPEPQRTESAETVMMPAADSPTSMPPEQAEPEQRAVPPQSAMQTNENGWGGLLASVGLDGFGDIGRNLGYVLAMLPDMLAGIFTGKTKSLGMKDNLLPIASIVAGMFVKNPILKMLLIGMGGANLLNKAGHEALEHKQNEGKENINTGVRYRQYADEPLNSRIEKPVLQGNSLIATIDKVPCTIQLTGTVADACRAGALPLNTLANAVLAKSDQMRQMASQNYDDSRQDTVVRTRGIQ